MQKERECVNKRAKDRPMRLVVVGASGRMGRELIRTIAANHNVRLVGAIVRPDSAWLGHDCGEMAGIDRNGIALAGADALWQEFTIGLLIIIAVSIDQWIRRISA